MNQHQAIHHPSPNVGPRIGGPEIDMLILHYTGMQSAQEALSKLCDPTAKVSAHYFICENGTIYQLAEEKVRAWHAGVSYWSGETDINSRSIGIELQNPGHEFNYHAFADEQMEPLTDLCIDILRRHPIPPERVLGHSDVAPARKKDPGELFDWHHLAKNKIGRIPRILSPPPTFNATWARERLNQIGYDPEAEFRVILTAFQRHFRQNKIDGRLDQETAACIRSLTE